MATIYVVRCISTNKQRCGHGARTVFGSKRRASVSAHETRLLSLSISARNAFASTSIPATRTQRRQSPHPTMMSAATASVARTSEDRGDHRDYVREARGAHEHRHARHDPLAGCLCHNVACGQCTLRIAGPRLGSVSGPAMAWVPHAHAGHCAPYPIVVIVMADQ
jgi:hypothetical protein